MIDIKVKIDIVNKMLEHLEKRGKNKTRRQNSVDTDKLLKQYNEELQYYKDNYPEYFI